MDGFADKVGFIWAVADLLRGDYKAHEYGRVILPLTVLRRLDATLTETKASVLAKDADLERQGLHNRAKVLERVAGVPFYNTSPLDFRRLLDDPEHIAANLRTYKLLPQARIRRPRPQHGQSQTQLLLATTRRGHCPHSSP